MRRITLLSALLIAALVAGSAAYGHSTLKRKPWPRTAAKAIALVKSNSDMNNEVTPFQKVLGWHASWRGDQWWVVGLFQSQWGERFVGDASIFHRHVYAYISPGRPSQKWVKKYAHRHWHLHRFYTRFTDAAAIQSAEAALGIPGAGYSFTVLDAAAKLAVDSQQHVKWYFALYVQAQDSTKYVYTITGLGPSNPVEEGMYVDGYGFGGQPTLDTSVPLELQSWVQAVAKARGWQPSNP